jgi:hypothetical protein
MLNCSCREHLICYACCGTDITTGAQYATFTCGGGKEFNTTAFVNLHIYDVYVNIIL